MPEPRYEQIGKRIKEAREKAGLTQGELAEKIGFTTATAVSLIESGERRFDVGTLERIATVLNCEIDYFFEKDAKAADLKAGLQDVKVALRAVNGLKPDDREAVTNFIDFLRKKRSGK